MSGPVIVGIRPTLPVEGVSLILGNDLAGGRVQPDPQVISNPNSVLSANEGLTQTFQACVVTRAAARRAQVQANSDSNSESITPGGTSQAKDPVETERSEQQTVNESQSPVEASDFSISCGQLIHEQESDKEIFQLAKYAVNKTEASQEGQCFTGSQGC